MAKKTTSIWIGHAIFLGLSGLWIVCVLGGFASFGWGGRLSDLSPIEFVVQVSALVFPIVFLYLLGAYIDRNRMIDLEIQATKSYLEELVYPSELGAKHISDLNVDLKEQIKHFKVCYEDVFKQATGIRETLTSWIADLNSILTHMGEQTDKMSDYVHKFSEVNALAQEQSADAGQNLATQADILMNVTDQVHEHLSDTAKTLKSQTEEITQNVHAIVRAEENIDNSLNASAKWVSELSDNARHIEKSMKTTDSIKTFLKDTDAVLLKCQEIGTTLDLRLKALKKNMVKEDLPVPTQEIVLSAKEFTEKMQHILEQLQGLSVEMVSVFDLKNEEALWERYYAGDKAIFMRHIQTLFAQQKYQKTAKKLLKDTSFCRNAQEYMKTFESLTHGLENSPWLGVLVGSDPGRLYMVLATFFKGDGNAHKID